MCHKREIKKKVFALRKMIYFQNFFDRITEKRDSEYFIELRKLRGEIFLKGCSAPPPKTGYYEVNFKKTRYE